MAGSVVQGVGTGFKPQYCKNKIKQLWSIKIRDEGKPGHSPFKAELSFANACIRLVHIL
jgi:hypothetical protein